MHVQIPHTGESMAGHWTPCNPAIVRTLMIRVVSTVWLVFTPSFFNLKRFTTKRSHKTALGDYRISPMFGPMMLAHTVNTGILLVTNCTRNFSTLHTCLCVLCQIPSIYQHLPTLTTWEFLIPVYTHVDNDSVVGLEDLSAHRTGSLTSRYSWNLIVHLSNFPGLCSSWQVFTLKKGRHLLLDSLQGPLLYHQFVLSYLGLCWNRFWLYYWSWRSTKTASGDSRCRFQALCLILTGESY